ncbi:hypothetical protein [Coleofasciculus sp. FACHB-501]|nr:hypothetical protein [Coleofasciculus sp. FACHB-501]MBD1838326.1 hypothetical protein [Coleofasciculus sp. FACHB-501]
MDGRRLAAIAYSPLGMKTAKRGVSLALTCQFASLPVATDNNLFVL